MILYDYKCAQCAQELELFAKMDDNANKDCPSCNAPSMEKQITGTKYFDFKGEGTYDKGWKSHG